MNESFTLAVYSSHRRRCRRCLAISVQSANIAAAAAAVAPYETKRQPAQVGASHDTREYVEHTYDGDYIYELAVFVCCDDHVNTY